MKRLFILLCAIVLMMVFPISALADDETQTNIGTVIESVFQVLFVVIMSVGILGLPVYYYLNARRKRIASEHEENNDDEKEAPVEE